MNKTEKLIINTLKAAPDRTIFYYDLDFDQPDNELTKTLSETDFFDCVKYLASQGLIEYVPNQDGRHIGIHASYECMHKAELDRREAFQNFFTHYLPGFISGIFATVVAEILARYVLLALGIQ